MAETVQFQDRPPRRKVWVVNLHPTKAYEEKYRDELVSVPPNQEKKVLMDLIMAEKFLSKPTVPQEFDAAGREITMGKPLKIVELTDDETHAHDPRNAKEIKKEAKETENQCTICGIKTPTPKGLGLHVKRVHPEYEPIKEL